MITVHLIIIFCGLGFEFVWNQLGSVGLSNGSIRVEVEVGIGLEGSESGGFGCFI